MASIMFSTAHSPGSVTSSDFMPRKDDRRDPERWGTRSPPSAGETGGGGSPIVPTPMYGAAPLCKEMLQRRLLITTSKAKQDLRQRGDKSRKAT